MRAAASRSFPVLAVSELRPGLLLGLEPWVMEDTDVLMTDADGLTLRSAVADAEIAALVTALHDRLDADAWRSVAIPSS